MNQSEFEIQLMGKLLCGNDPVLEGLRHQYDNSTLESRKFTGVGFFTHFKVNVSILPVASGKTFQIGDVDAHVDNIVDAIGFVLFVEKGYLSTLEGYTLLADKWPNDYSKVALFYDGPDGKRDFEKLKSNWE